MDNLRDWITAIVACFGFLMGCCQYRKETKRRKQSETLDLYNKLFRETYDLRDEYCAEIPDADLFAYKDLATGHDDLCNKVYNLLTHFESFAKGLEYDIYDFGIFISQTPQEMFEILNILTQFVYEARNEKGYNLLFNDFIALVNYTSLCMQRKQSHKKFPRKYKQLRV
ncbi:MAG: hypothetical protein NC416_13025 [Eubacterium sp.]|nr:hypothetical protein [Eubacterium sp.]